MKPGLVTEGLVKRIGVTRVQSGKVPGPGEGHGDIPDITFGNKEKVFLVVLSLGTLNVTSLWERRQD